MNETDQTPNPEATTKPGFWLSPITLSLGLIPWAVGLYGICREKNVDEGTILSEFIGFMLGINVGLLAVMWAIRHYSPASRKAANNLYIFVMLIVGISYASQRVNDARKAAGEYRGKVEATVGAEMRKQLSAQSEAYSAADEEFHGSRPLNFTRIKSREDLVARLEVTKDGRKKLADLIASLEGAPEEAFRRLEAAGVAPSHEVFIKGFWKGADLGTKLDQLGERIKLYEKVESLQSLLLAKWGEWSCEGNDMEFQDSSTRLRFKALMDEIGKMQKP